MSKQPKGQKRHFSEAYTPTRLQYERLCERYEALRDEGAFMLRSEIQNRGIKIHAIESRVKDFDSMIAKINSRALHGFGELVDVVGIRVICLFRSDLARVGQIIGDLFDVKQTEDKVTESSDSFGYMSVHYVCRFPYTYNGPRYEKISGEIFEIQVRTLCMHAWAAVSHYFDYKAETDIPDELKKGLNALSGLFYVADDQYEKIFDARLRSKKGAVEASLKELLDAEMNLDTFSSYIRKKFPEREHISDSSVSTLLENLKSFGYVSIRDVDSVISKGLAKAEERERNAKKISEQVRYYGLAMTRLSIYGGNPEFKKFEEAIGRIEIALRDIDEISQEVDSA